MASHSAGGFEERVDSLNCSNRIQAGGRSPDGEESFEEMQDRGASGQFWMAIDCTC